MVIGEVVVIIGLQEVVLVVIMVEDVSNEFEMVLLIAVVEAVREEFVVVLIGVVIRIEEVVHCTRNGDSR